MSELPKSTEAGTNPPPPSPVMPPALPPGTTQIQAQVMMQQAIWQGQLPPPQALEAYKRIDERLFQFVLDEAGRNGQHQRDMETEASSVSRMVNKGAVDQGNRGQWLAAVVVIAGFILAGWIAYIGRSASAYWAGGTIGGVELVSLAYVFVTGRRKPESQSDTGETPEA